MMSAQWISLFINMCCLSVIPMKFSKYHQQIDCFFVGKYNFPNRKTTGRINIKYINLAVTVTKQNCVEDKYLSRPAVFTIIIHRTVPCGITMHISQKILVFCFECKERQFMNKLLSKDSLHYLCSHFIFKSWLQILLLVFCSGK